MLTAANLVANAAGKRIALPKQTEAKRGSTLSGLDTNCIIYDLPIGFELDGDKISASKSSLSGADGVYISNRPNTVTLGVIFGSGVLLSDQFGGCDFAVFKTRAGIVGAHIYSSETCRGYMADNQLPTGWSRICTWRSSGYADLWPDNGGLVVVAYVAAPNVRIVALGLSGGYPVCVNNVDDVGTYPF